MSEDDFDDDFPEDEDFPEDDDPSTPVVPTSSEVSQKTHFVKILNYCEQCFWETGLLPTVDKLSETLSLEKTFCSQTLRSEKLKTQLAARGIDFDPTTTSKVLTPKQIVVANLMLNLHDKRSEREKLELCNVSSQQYHAWLRQPQFVEFMRKRGEALFKSSDAEAYKALVRNVKAGDNKAIDLFFQMRGIHTPRLNVDVNIESILIRVVEVVSKYVTDPVALYSIADEIETLLPRNANSTPKELTSG